MRPVRMPYALLGVLSLIPFLASAQPSKSLVPYPFSEMPNWNQAWLWMVVLVVALISLVAWGLSYDRTHRHDPPLL